MKLKLFIAMLITFSLNINNISWNFGYTQIGDKPFDGEMLYGHHENYGKIGDYSIHSSKTVIGENNEYIFAMIFPRYNDLKDEGFTRSGLYRNDGKNTPVYYLPEVDGCYAQISRNGQDVWLIRKEWLPWSFGVEPGDIDMSLPLFRYYKRGELQYTVCLSDVFTEDMLLRNGQSFEGIRWHYDYNFDGNKKLAFKYEDFALEDNSVYITFYVDRYTGKVTDDQPDGNFNPYIVFSAIGCGVVIAGVIAAICLRKRKKPNNPV